MARTRTVSLHVHDPELEITYDPEAKAYYLRLRPGPIGRTVEVEAGVYADLYAGGELVGVEILKPVSPETLETVAERFRSPGLREAVPALAEFFTVR